KVNDLLSSRFKKASEKLSKMTNLAEMSTSGSLSSFSGVFRVTPLSENEEEHLRNILSEYSKDNLDIASDLKFLSAITSEVKAINNQAAILHGERIKRAQEVLKKYRDGAFSSWLISTYGNRQTPYNFLQYFKLYSAMPKLLQDKVDTMPRQAVYTLATRNCPQEAKEDIVKNYRGESKKELLTLIRQRFPLAQKDKRAPNITEQLISQLHHLNKQFSNPRFKPSDGQKKRVLEVLTSIQKKL
ncbi:MAG: hypothetical protein K1000chlam2_01644, partial [Chlamydiae bacterium]|nr:hypothetical protein [Chlamydiota bacterium]